jgi:hypothetical protein
MLQLLRTRNIGVSQSDTLARYSGAYVKRIVAALMALMAPILSANAALISADSVAGPGSAVLDTNTGKEWLKLSVTANLTPSQVFAAMAPGGRFEGFHYAGYQELTCELLGSYAGLGCPSWVTYDVQPVWQLFQAFGLSGRPGSRVYHTVSTFNTDIPETYIFGSAFFYYDEPRPEFDFDTQQVLLNAARLDQPAAHWLVSDPQYVAKDATDVVEPPVIALFGLGALILALKRTRRRM